MEAEKLIEALHMVEKFKRTMRHCYTSDDRKESVAEHCWRVALMANWMEDEFPEVDINKVIKMCLIHDLGECFTGDIPCFKKKEADEETEENLLYQWVATLPEPLNDKMRFYCSDDKVDLEQYPYHVRDVHISDPFILADPKSRCYYTYVQFADTERFPDVETDKENGVFYVLESKDLIHWSKPQICFRQNNFWADKDYWAPEVQMVLLVNLILSTDICGNVHLREMS